MKKKVVYSAPVTEVLAMKSEGVICGSVNATIAITAFDPIPGGGDYDVQHWD